MAKYKKKFIDLFYQTWTIEFVEDIPSEDGRFIWGDCDCVSRIIKIRTKKADGKDMSKGEVERTLIHELLHAISAAGAFWSDISETQTEFTAVCLHKVLSQLKVSIEI